MIDRDEAYKEITSYDADKVSDVLNMNRKIFHVAMMMLPNNFRRMHGLPLKRNAKRRRKRWK